MKNRRVLYIDGQIFQTAAKDRGMGRYAASLIQAIQSVGHENYSKIYLVLTNKLPLSPSQRNELSKIFADIEILRVDLWTTNNADYESAVSHNRKVLNKSMVVSGQADYFIPALFQEPTVCIFPDNVNKLLLFYDLVPFLYHKRYAPLIPFDNYLKRFKTLYEADVIFTISNTVADDIKQHLGINKSRIINIDGAAITPVTPKKPIKNFPLSQDFILMPTSDDPRKNNLRAVLGFEEFRATPKYKDVMLVITSKISARERAHLELFSNHLYFTGNLEEEELDWLYTRCAAVLFVPEYEGLGLPILEAVNAKKRIVCSSINVFQEISQDAFYYCDHEDQESIALALKRAFKSGAMVNEKLYSDIKKHYSWKQTARRFIETRVSQRGREQKMRIAVFTPAPSGLSAIGKVVAETHDAMSEKFEVDYFIEEGLHDNDVRPDFLKYVARCYPAQLFGVDKYAKYDAVVYHIGNGDYHIQSIRTASYLPGYIIIHDTNIEEAYRVLLEERLITQERYDLEKNINRKSHVSKSKFLNSIVNSQEGVVVHSKYAYSAVKEALSSKADDAALVCLNLPTAVADITPPKDDKQIRIGLAGIIADIKGLQVIEKMAKSTDFTHTNLSLFGFNHAPKSTINRLRSYDNVTVTTDLSDFEFMNRMSGLHFFMNYRLDYNGETSLSTLEAMRQGVVVVVRDIGWYSELPDNAVVKATSIEDAIEQLRRLLESPRDRREISIAAKKYIQESHSHVKYVAGLEELIRRRDKNDHSISSLLKHGSIKNTKQYLEAIIRGRK